MEDLKKAWNNDEEKRKYFREYHRRKRGGLKRHPNILDDGTLYTETEEYKQALEAKKALKKSQRKQLVCQICLHTYFDTEEEDHFETDRHKYAVRVAESVIKQMQIKGFRTTQFGNQDVTVTL